MKEYFESREEKFLRCMIYATVIIATLLVMIGLIDLIESRKIVEPTPAPKVVVYECRCEECQKTPEEKAAEIAAMVEEMTAVEVEPAAYEEIDTVKYFDVPLDENLQDHIFQLCQEREIDPALVFAMIKKESWYDPNLKGDGGNSYGLMQVQPKWHQARMDKLGVTDLMDPYQNVEVAIDYLDELFDKGKSLEWTLMAYNGGPSGANKNESKGVVTSYVTIVMDYVEELEESVIYG